MTFRIKVMSTLVAWTLGRTSLMPALAATAPPSPDPTSAGQSQQPVQRFDIAPGLLDAVLRAFQAVCGWTVSVPADVAAVVRSAGVSGVYTPEQALERLLSGTGVTYRLIGPQAAALELRRSDTVLVTALTPRISSPKYTEPLRDVPQSITVIPRAVFQEQGATTLREVLSNVPGITMVAGEGGTPAGDNLTIRGFNARNDVFVDNVRDLGPQTRDPFNLEQVEVVKGPGSVFSGRGSTGGTVNMVSKSPALATYYGGSLAGGSDETVRVTADFNQPLDRLLGGAALRLNVMGHQADVAGRNAVENGRWGIAPTLALGLGTPSRLTLSYFHLEQDNLSDYGIPWVTATHNVLAAYRNQPAPVPRETFYGLRSRDQEETASDLATARFEHDWRPSLTLRSQLRYGHSTRDSMATPPRFASNDTTVINREMRSWITEDEIVDLQTDLTARFSGEGLDHALVTGFALTHEGNLRTIRTAPNMQTTLLDPNPDDVFPGAIAVSPDVGDVTGRSAALYAFDTVTVGGRWELTGGLRYDHFEAEGVATPPEPVEQTADMLSFRLGAVYKPRPNGSVYAAYGNSLNPSLEGLSYGTANTAIDPEKTYTFEVGTKWDLLKERLALTAAAFRIDKTNARTPGLLPDDPPQVLEGRQRVDGVELAVTGGITSRWKVFAGYTYLDGRVEESNNPLEVGHPLSNTPEDGFVLWTTWETPWRLAVAGGAHYTGRRYANTTTDRHVDGHWLLDAMASFRVTRQLDLQLNGYNLTNAYYFDRLGGGHVVPGPARRALLTANVTF
jgi:catecholate siderophore receptor